jgi:hypothetical protein
MTNAAGAGESRVQSEAADLPIEPYPPIYAATNVIRSAGTDRQ